MNLPPRDYTQQEQIIARCLDEFGLRYEQQAYYHPYILDFYIGEIKMAIEAVLDSNEIEFDQIPSMGCNIKWK